MICTPPQEKILGSSSHFIVTALLVADAAREKECSLPHPTTHSKAVGTGKVYYAPLFCESTFVNSPHISGIQTHTL